MSVQDINEPLRDWTEGGLCLSYQACTRCHRVWAFRRDFCPECGDRNPERRRAGGKGVVHAFTRVERAPSDEFRALAPYAIVLVDMAEGFRIMAHGALELRIGDPVQVEVRELAGRLLPHFSRIPNES